MWCLILEVCGDFSSNFVVFSVLILLLVCFWTNASVYLVFDTEGMASQ